MQMKIRHKRILNKKKNEKEKIYENSCASVSRANGAVNAPRLAKKEKK